MAASVADQTSFLHQEEDARASHASTEISNQDRPDYYNNYTGSSSGVSEIEEENSSDLFEINHAVPLESIKEDIEGSLFSFDVHDNGDRQGDCVYVGVGKSESSVDALSWTLKNAVTDSNTTDGLEIQVLTPILTLSACKNKKCECVDNNVLWMVVGRLPKSQVSAQQVENHMAQERGKRRELLQKYINMCSASKVKVDTILIESDMVGKAMVDLIPILNMTKLVLGTSKSNLRKLKSKRGNGIADQVLQNAPEFCDVTIVCDGKEVVIDQMIGSPLPSPLSDNHSAKSLRLQDQSNATNDSFACMCFKSPKVM
ncbi:unnamed protein product [Dovyalis caffra]|uniref:Uncharacterized protein n=1 Tax=Dovyalis caffra TaxID=77055 RepID=A0AAV1QQS7_9ROSI|nr:unnamed protein product [Dovyalis caffra]